MQAGDRERWDAKYRGKLGQRESAPDEFVLSALDELGPGAGRRALDLAAGSGRHALELARRGWRTSAWDVSAVGLGRLQERARAAGLSVELKCLDVLPLRSVGEPFELILCTDFLDRELWQSLGQWLLPGGHAVLATFSLDWSGERPPERFRLRPGELARGLPGLETLRTHELGGRAGMLARRTP